MFWGSAELASTGLGSQAPSPTDHFDRKRALGLRLHGIFPLIGVTLCFQLLFRLGGDIFNPTKVK